MKPENRHFGQAVRDSFSRQAFMKTLGASLVRVEAGRVEIWMRRSDQLLQQHGFLHAGAITSILDSACGYAALTLMSEGHEVLSVEFKVNLLAPAVGDAFVATGIVERSGRLSVCRGEFRPAVEPEPLIALMQATMIGRKK